MENEQIERPGDVNIDELSIQNDFGERIDLTLAQVTEINLYESVFAPCLFGQLQVVDADGFIEEFPIIGGEVLTINLRTKTFPTDSSSIIYKSFIITAIENRSLSSGDREQQYVLNFMSAEGINDANSTINQSLPGGGDEDAFNTAKIARKIFDEFIALVPRIWDEKDPSELTIGDAHESNIQYVSNGWSPFQNMNYLCQNIKEAETGGADNVFYESNKQFYLTSIQGLIKKQGDNIFDDYLVEGTTRQERDSSYDYYTRDLMTNGFNVIDELIIPKTIDLLEGSNNGYHASNVQAYDLFTKTKTIKSFDIVDDFPSEVHTDTGIPVPGHTVRNPETYTNFKILNGSTYYGIPSGIFDKGNKTSEDKWVGHNMRRQSYFKSFNNYTFEIKVPGRTDIEVGVMVNLEYPSAQTGNKSKKDEILSGKYLTTAIHHKVNITDGHTMKMEIVKNGLGLSLARET